MGSMRTWADSKTRWTTDQYGPASPARSQGIPRTWLWTWSLVSYAEQMIIGSVSQNGTRAPVVWYGLPLQVIFSKRTAAENCPFHCHLCTLHLFSQSLATIFRSYRGRQREGLPAQPPVHAPGPIQARSLEESSLSEMRNSGCKGFGEDPFVPYRRS